MSNSAGTFAVALNPSSWEADLVADLRASLEYELVARCVDIVDLVACVDSQSVDIVIVDANMSNLSASALAHLARRATVFVVGLSSTTPMQYEAAHYVAVVPTELGVAVETIVSHIQSASHEPVKRSAPLARDRNLMQGQGTVVAVWSGHGAPGRSMIATSLTEVAARTRSAILVDADTHAPSLAASLGIADDASGLIAACRHADHFAIDSTSLAKLARSVDGRWRVLTGISSPQRWPEVRAESFRRVLQASRALCDITVVDIAASFERDDDVVDDYLIPRRDATGIVALSSADVVVLVGACEPVALTRLLQARQQLMELAPDVPVAIVLNKVRPSVLGSDGRNGVIAFVSEQTGVKDVVVVPQDAAACDGAALRCNTIAEFAPRSALLAAIADLNERLSVLAPQWNSDGIRGSASSGTNAPNNVAAFT